DYLKLDLSNPKTLALHKLYRKERITPRKKGYELLLDSKLSKGMAFSLYERFYLGLHGLIPPAFMTEEQQVYRVMKRIRAEPNDLAR
ncbi:Malic enzyme, partial [Trichostrongylus colubriformis]